MPLLVHMVTIFRHLRNSRIVPHRVGITLFSCQQCVQVPVSLHLANVGIINMSGHSHPTGHEMIFRCAFDLNFPYDCDVEHPFMCYEKRSFFHGHLKNF